jgi:hypothetical protein
MLYCRHQFHHRLQSVTNHFGIDCVVIYVDVAIIVLCFVTRLDIVLGDLQSTWTDGKSLHATAYTMSYECCRFVWLLAIVWSTVAVRQHVVLDVVAGLGWGLLFAALSHRLSPGIAWRPGR